MRSFMFQEEELAARFPPAIGIPGCGTHLHLDPGADGGNSIDLPDYMGRTFPAMCQFWLLTSEWTAVYYTGDRTPVGDRVSLEFAQRTFQKLLD
jgi:hypothetical protein